MQTDNARSSRPIAGPRLSVLAPVLLALGAAAALLAPLEDPDLWWHLSGARAVLAQHGWWLVDHSSFLQSGTWVDTEWLFQLGLYAAWRAGGPEGVTITVALAAGVTAWLLTRTHVAEPEGDAPAAALPHPGRLLLVSLTVLAISDQFAPRPQSLMLLGLALALQRLGGPPPTRRGILWLGLGQLVWAQIHVSHVLLPLLLLFPAAEALSGRDSKVALAWGRAALVCGVVALLANPRSVGVIQEVFHHAGSDSARHIADMRPPALADLWPTGWGPQAAALLVWAVGLSALGAGRARPTGFWRDAACFVLGTALALTAVRFRAAGALLALPLALQATSPGAGRSSPVRTAGSALVCIVALLLVPGTSLAKKAGHFGVIGLRGLHLPEDAARLLETGTGNLYNHYEDGGYLGWRLAGRWAIAIDGRTPTFFTAETHTLWRQAQRSLDTFRQLTQTVGVDAALVRKDSMLCRRLRDGSDWRAAYVDLDRTLFVPAGSGIAPGVTLRALALCDDQPVEGSSCADAEAQWAEASTLDALTPNARYPGILGLRLAACRQGDASHLADVAAALIADDAGPDWMVATDALAAAGRTDEALAAAREGAARFDEGQYALDGARIAQAAGRDEDVLRMLDDASRRLDDAFPVPARLAYAQRLAAAGRLDEAATQARQAAWAGQPGAAELLERLGAGPQRK